MRNVVRLREATSNGNMAVMIMMVLVTLDFPRYQNVLRHENKSWAHRVFSNKNDAELQIVVDPGHLIPSSFRDQQYF